VPRSARNRRGINLEARRFKRGHHALAIGGEQLIVGGRSQHLDIGRAGKATQKFCPRQVPIGRYQPIEKFDAGRDFSADGLDPAEIGLSVRPVVGKLVGSAACTSSPEKGI
jgi:hypothetical protein